MPPRRAWLAATAALVIMVSIGALYAWSVFVAPLEAALGASRSASSAVFSLAVASFTLSMLFGARLYPYARPEGIALATLALAAAGFALAGWGQSIPAVAIGFGGLFGCANGLGYGFSLQVAQQALPHRRGLITGIAVAAYTLGSAAFALLFAWGIRTLGLDATFRATALYMLAVGALAYLLLKAARLQFAEPARQPASRAAGASGAHVFWILWLGFLLGAFAGVMVLGHAAAIVGSFGGTPQQMALGASLVAAGNGIGRLAGGWLADRMPARRLLSAMMLLAGSALLLILGAPTPAAASAALFTMGAGYGAMAGGYPVVVSQLYGIASVSRVYGRVFTAWGVAGLAGPLLAGVLFDQAHDYRLALLLGGGAALGAGLVCAAIPARDAA
jgi:OFA family oxalate/formate antiporter-like MFS transporter